MDFKKSMAIFVAAFMLIGCIIPLVSNGNEASNNNYFIDGGEHIGADNIPTGYTPIYDVEGLKNMALDLTKDYILMNDITFTASDNLAGGVILSVGATASSSNITVTVKYKLSESDTWITDGVSVKVWFKGTEYTTANGVATITGKYTNGDPYFISVSGTVGEGTNEKAVVASVYSPNATAATVEKNSTGNFEMLEVFSKTLDGNGYTINGMDVVGANSGAAMFKGITNTVKNLGFTNLRTTSVGTTGDAKAGGITLDLGGSAVVQNCFVAGSVLSSALVTGKVSYAGGIATVGSGSIKASYTTNAVASMTVDGTSYAGGMTSDNSGTIDGCYNSGTVLSEVYGGTETAAAGGIAGHGLTGTIQSSHNTGAVKASSNGMSYAGGVIGYGETGMAIYSSYNNGAVTSVTSNANKVGDVGSYQAYAGGVAGKVDTIYKCYNTGAVSARATSTGTSDPKPTSHAYSGGVAGGCMLIYNCYSNVSYTSVTASSGSLTSERAFKGGISGMIEETGALVNCYYLAPSSGDSVLYGKGIGITVDGELPANKVIITIDFDDEMGSVEYKIANGAYTTYTVPFILTKDDVTGLTPDITVKASPNSNYVFSAWDGLDTNETEYKFNTGSYVDITAVFLKENDDGGNSLISTITVDSGVVTTDKIKYTVTMELENNETYTYSGIYAGPLTVKKGASVTLESGTSGRVVTSWSGDFPGDTPTLTFTPNTDTISITAVFADVSTSGFMTDLISATAFSGISIMSANTATSLQKSGPKTADQLKSFNTYFNGETDIWDETGSTHAAMTIYGWFNSTDPGAKWTKTNSAGGTSDPSINNNYPYLEGIIPGQVHILSNPSNVNTEDGSATSFKVIAVSDVTMSFQWQSNSSISDSGWSNISNETSDTYNVTASSTTAGKYYRCRVSVSVGGSTYYTYSDAAKLSIDPVEIKTLDDLLNINNNLGGTFVQKADLYFVKDGTSYDKNGGIDITMTPSINGSDLVLAFTYVNNSNNVAAQGLKVWIDGVQKGTTNSTGVFTIPRSDVTDGSHTIIIGGAIGSNGVAVSYDLTVSDSPSVAVGTKSSNGLFSPIGTPDHPFTGSYDGNGYKIYGLEIGSYAGGGTVLAGLFGYSEGTIKNVAIEGGYSLAMSNGPNAAVSGGIAAMSAGSIQTSYSTATVTAISDLNAVAGGIAGSMIDDATISGSYNTGSISAYCVGTASAGGIAGDAGVADGGSGNILNCYNTGGISAATNAGGIIGLDTSDSKVSDCYSTGTISAATSAGGIVGSTDGGYITNCYFLNTSAAAMYSGHAYRDGATVLDTDARTDVTASGAKTDSQMKSKSTYYTGNTTVAGSEVAGWDFTSGNVWIMSDGSLPTLKAVVPSGGDGGDDGGFDWMLIVGIIAAILVVALVGYVLYKRRKA